MSDNKPAPDRIYVSPRQAGKYPTKDRGIGDLHYMLASTVEAQLATVRRKTAEHAAEIAGRYDDWRGDGNVVDEVARAILSEILGEQQAADWLEQNADYDKDPTNRSAAK